MDNQQTTSSSAVDLLKDIILLDLLTDNDQPGGLLSDGLASTSITRHDTP